jgi:broad specificity phosphatase PhoE
MSLTLYFLRHGETAASLSHVFCGALDPPLTPQGEAMAADFAAAYKNRPWAAVYCSPQGRAMATAKPLCDALGIRMQLRDGLKEIDFGKWEGQTEEAVRRDYHDDFIRWSNDPGWSAPSGGQRAVDLARISGLVLEEIEKNCPSGNVLVVSHKATIRIMLCSLLGIDVGRFRDRLDIPVSSLSVVEMAARGPLMRMMGDRSHLSQELRSRPGT